MAFDFLATKKKARQALHDTLGVFALHISAETGVSSKCRVRVHTKIMLAGDVDYQGFAELSDGAVMIHCPIVEARALNFTMGDKIIYDNKVYVLNTRKDDDGIYLETWFATHSENEYAP